MEDSTMSTNDDGHGDGFMEGEWANADDDDDDDDDERIEAHIEAEAEVEVEDEDTYDDGDEVDAGDHEEIEVGNTPPVDEPVNLGHNHQHSYFCGAGCPVYDAAIGSPWPADAPTVQPESEPEPERPPASTPAVRARAKKVRKPKAGSKAKSARAASKPKRKRAVKVQSKGERR
jgi:hypothetical protein